MATLEKAIALAATHHAGQTDKAGQPYILHVLRVIGGCRSHKAQIAAALHDVPEDTSVTLADLLAMGFDPTIVEAVDCLTKRKGESRTSAAKRARSNPIALEVKLADNMDNMDNMDITRLSTLEEWDLLRFREYFLVRQLLLAPQSETSS